MVFSVVERPLAQKIEDPGSSLSSDINLQLDLDKSLNHSFGSKIKVLNWRVLSPLQLKDSYDILINLEDNEKKVKGY